MAPASILPTARTVDATIRISRHAAEFSGLGTVARQGYRTQQTRFDRIG
jgi:hypothetical protein